MGINVNLNYSTLFSSLSSNSFTSSNAGSSMNFLSDYASLKNGSYKKLLNAYYAKNNAENISSSNSKDNAKTLASIDTAADALKESADKLISRGSQSLFNKKDITTTDENGVKTTKKDYDMDAIYKAVKGFTDNYNSLLDATTDSNSNNILRNSLSMTNTTKAHSKMLAEVGITVGKDNKLSIDEEMFKSADMTTLKTLFNGNNSYAYKISASASKIDFYAQSEAQKGNTYTLNGSFSNPYSSGNIYNSFF